MLLQRGDRVRITGILPDDPAPLPIGLEGTVTTVMNQATALEQIAVDWDLIPGAERPRSVMLLPGDPFEKILTEEQKPAPRTRRPAAPRKPRAAPKPPPPKEDLHEPWDGPEGGGIYCMDHDREEKP